MPFKQGLSPLDPDFILDPQTREPKKSAWFDVYLRGIIENFAFKTMARADIVLKQHYETVFGIFDHRQASASNTRPLVAMAFTPGRDTGQHEALTLRLQAYEDAHVFDICKMTFIEYMQMTRYAQHELTVKCRKIFAQREADEEARRQRMQQELANGMNATPGDPK